MRSADIIEIMFGSAFLFAGLTACAIAAVHRRSGSRVFVWLGTWSAMYGALHVMQAQSVVAASPPWLRTLIGYASTAFLYLLAVFGLLSFLEFSVGAVRVVLKLATGLALAIAVAAMAMFVATGNTGSLILLNNLVAASTLVLLITVAGAKLSGKYLLLPNRRVLAAGTLVFAVEAVYNSTFGKTDFALPRVFDHLGFAALLGSFAYVALESAIGNERRLVAMDNELAVAREIQSSILPSSVPAVAGTRIAAMYEPMTAVAGDFYDFVPVDQHRAGFLIADVCGHGVPAALIASMVKVAAQMVRESADDPSAVLRELNRILSGQLRGQLVSAAYLWVDTEKRRALYSAAGHPPVLRWRDGTLEQIESNGILFGVLPGFDNYPVRELLIAAGDRFLLYTDGVTECENEAGDAFGDARLEQVLRARASAPATELADRLVAELRSWHGRQGQQDDITLVVVDVV